MTFGIGVLVGLLIGWALCAAFDRAMGKIATKALTSAIGKEKVAAAISDVLAHETSLAQAPPPRPAGAAPPPRPTR